MKIIVSVTNDLVIDQRVHKVCTSLMQNGHDVTLVGRKFKNSLPLSGSGDHKGRLYATTRMRLLFNQSALFYAEYNFRLFLYLLCNPADVFWSNDTDTLPANYLASKIRRKKLVFDAHEMFPEMPEVIHRKLVKSVWTKIEDWLFPRLEHSMTVCLSIADVYRQKYGMDMRVVRNIPFAGTQPITQSPIDKKGKKVLLYQGVINVGRGIEWIIDAMPYLPEFVFYVVGSGDILDELKDKVQQLQLNEQVIFTGQIPFDQLPAYTSAADIGINLLENQGLNYYYALPNRIFDYMRAHVPVLTVDFPEIRRIVSHYNIGTLIDHFEPEFLAKTLRIMAAQAPNEQGFEQANAELRWEKEAENLPFIVKYQ